MRRFFKIFGIVVGIILIVFIGLNIYAHFWFKKKNENAQKIAQAVESFESTNSEAYKEYSVARFNKAGDFHTGFVYLNKAVELDPVQHLGYRGWIRLRKIRDYDKALFDFNRLDSLTPSFVDAPWGENIDFLRGECYYGKKNYEKAIFYFNRSIVDQGEEWADIQTFVYLGLCENQLGNYQKAIFEFKRALKQSKETTEAHFGMAKAYLKLAKVDSAKTSIKRAHETIAYKRDDRYNEFLNEIYLSEILELKDQIQNISSKK